MKLSAPLAPEKKEGEGRKGRNGQGGKQEWRGVVGEQEEGELNACQTITFGPNEAYTNAASSEYLRTVSVCERERFFGSCLYQLIRLAGHPTETLIPL